MECALCDLKIGQSAMVTSVNSKGDILRRLLDIGIISGTKVKCVFKSPLGDPTAFLIRDAVIALRKEDSANITVVKEIGTYYTVGR